MRLLYVLLALCVAKSNSQRLLGSIVGGVTKTVGKVVDGTVNAVTGVTGVVTDILPVPGINRNSDCSGDVRNDYKNAVHEFHTTFFNNVAAKSDNHFVYSPYPIWLALGALAEGSDPAIRSQLFAKLLLPQDSCLRKSFYDLAIGIEQPANDVTITNNRILYLDEDAQLNQAWYDLVKTSGLLNVDFAPIRDPVAMAQTLQKYFDLEYSTGGNSIVLNSLEYKGLWTTGFSSMSEEPFYSDLGQQIGTVEMMRVKKRVRLAHLPFLKSKVLELPVGTDGRYTMMLNISLGKSFVKNSLGIFMSSIIKIFSLLQMSLVPIDIAIPKFTMSSQFDARRDLEQMGYGDFTNNPAATSYISSPPALPSSIIQQISIHIEPEGLTKASELPKDGLISGAIGAASNAATGLAAAVGREFIANKPFIFALIETKTKTCVFAGAYSRPNAS